MEQLFDLTLDPKEENDVLHDPIYASILQEMRQRHDQLQAECCVDVATIGKGIDETPNTMRVPPRKDSIAEQASELQDWILE